MKNVRNSSKSSTPRKTVKRLHPAVNHGNSLWEKLEPTLPMPKKQTKFKSPYRSCPLSQLNTRPEGSTSDDMISRTCTVKIKPIDPFKFCESATEKSKKGEISKRAPNFKKTLKAQKKVHQEVLALIQKTAATIKMIRKKNEC